MKIFIFLYLGEPFNIFKANSKKECYGLIKDYYLNNNLFIRKNYKEITMYEYLCEYNYSTIAKDIRECSLEERGINQTVIRVFTKSCNTLYYSHRTPEETYTGFNLSTTMIERCRIFKAEQRKNKINNLLE